MGRSIVLVCEVMGVGRQLLVVLVVLRVVVNVGLILIVVVGRVEVDKVRYHC